MSKISSSKKFWKGVDHPPTCLDDVFKYTLFSCDSDLTSSNVRPNIATSLANIATSFVKTKDVAMLSRDVAMLR